MGVLLSSTSDLLQIEFKMPLIGADFDEESNLVSSCLTILILKDQKERSQKKLNETCVYCFASLP